MLPEDAQRNTILIEVAERLIGTRVRLGYNVRGGRGGGPYPSRTAG